MTTRTSTPAAPPSAAARPGLAGFHQTLMRELRAAAASSPPSRDKAANDNADGRAFA